MKHGATADPRRAHKCALHFAAAWGHRGTLVGELAARTSLRGDVEVAHPAFSAHGGECRFVAPSEAAALPGKIIAIAVRLAGPSGRVHVEMPFKKLTIEDIVRMSTLKQQPSSRRR